MPNDMQLVKKIIQKARELFGKDFDYIVNCPAEIAFREEDEEFILESIRFIADGSYQDEISISCFGYPIITLEEGLFENLADCEGFEQFLNLEADAITLLPDYFKERVLVAKNMN